MNVSEFQALTVTSAPSCASGEHWPLCFSDLPGLGPPHGIFVLSDGIRLISAKNTIFQLLPSGRLSTIAGNTKKALKDGEGVLACFNRQAGFTIDRASNVVIADPKGHTAGRRQLRLYYSAELPESGGRGAGAGGGRGEEDTGGG